MAFRIGQKVVCVDAGTSPILVKNGIYTVTDVLMKPRWRSPGLLLAELKPRERYVAFESLLFRPVTDTKASASFTTGADPGSENWDNRRKVIEQV